MMMNKLIIEMVKNVEIVAESAALHGEYVSPEVEVVLVRPEGILCSSGFTEEFQENDYSDGSFWN